MTRLSRPTAGTRIQPPSAFERDAIARAVEKAHPAPSPRTFTGAPGGVPCRVLNTTEDDWPARSVVGIVPDSVTQWASDNGADLDPYLLFTAPLRFDGRVPRFPDDRNNCLITAENIRAGTTGWAWLAGHVVLRCHIHCRSHQYARPINLMIDRLESAHSGPCRIIYAEPDPDLLPDPDYGRLVVVELNGIRPPGEIIVGVLQQPLAAATWSTSAGIGRDAATALLRVYELDPDAELSDQTRYQYDVTDWTPTDPDNLEDGQYVQIDSDIRYRLVAHHPIIIRDSTGRDATYTVADTFLDSANWDGTHLRIPLEQPVADIRDDMDQPIVDGTVILPGAHRLSASDRYELVSNRGTNTRASGSIIAAINTGVEFLAFL